MTLKLTFLLVFSQVVYTDDPAYSARWFPVEAPRHALKYDGRQFASQDAPRPAGDREIMYCHYNKFGRLSPPSPIALISASCDNFEYGLSFSGTDRLNSATGAQIFERRPGDEAWIPCATEASVPWVVKPGSTFADGDDWLFSMFHRASPTPHERFNNVQTAFWQTSQENRPTRAPTVRVFSLRNEGYDIAYSNVCCNGETGLSAITVANADPSKRETHHNRILLRRADRYYPGVIGYYIYMRRSGTTQWHRQPTPYADVGPFKYNRPTEEYLWPATADRLQILNFIPSGIIPAPTASPQSFGNELQMALWTTAAPTVVVRGKLESLRCPLHLEYFGNWNQGSPGLGQAQKHNRTITTEYGGTVELTTTRDCPGGVKTPSLYWEALIIESQYSTITGLSIEHAVYDDWNNLIEGGRAGLAAHDWSGGQAFGPRLTNCEFWVYNADYPSWGLWQHESNTGKSHDGNHSLSELTATNCKFVGTTAAKITHSQSVNFNFIDCHLGSSGFPAPAHTCILSQGNSSRTVFWKSFKCGGARTIISDRLRGSFEIENLWQDEDAATLMEAKAYCKGTLRIKGNKLNRFMNRDFNVVTLPCGGVEQKEIDIRDLGTQINYPIEAVFFSQSYGRIVSTIDKNSASDLFQKERIGIRSPTYQEWASMGFASNPNWDGVFNPAWMLNPTLPKYLPTDITLRKNGVSYGRDGAAEVLSVKPRVVVPVP